MPLVLLISLSSAFHSFLHISKISACASLLSQALGLNFFLLTELAESMSVVLLTQDGSSSVLKCNGLDDDDGNKSDDREYKSAFLREIMKPCAQLLSSTLSLFPHILCYQHRW